MTKKITQILDVKRILRNVPHRDRTQRILKADKKIPLDEGFLEDVHDEGIDLMEEGKYEEAIYQFSKILNYSFEPEHSEVFSEWWSDALYHVSDAFSELGRNKQALSCIDSLLASEPNNVDYLLAKGYILQDLHRAKEALQYYKKILKTEPKDEQALVNMSSALIDLKKNKDAIRVSKKAIKLNPKNDDAWYNTGEALLNLKKYRESLESFLKVIKINPKEDEVWYMKARCLAHIPKRENESIDSLLVSISLNQKNKTKAKKEKDFQSLRSFDRYKKLVK